MGDAGRVVSLFALCSTDSLLYCTVPDSAPVWLYHTYRKVSSCQRFGYIGWVASSECMRLWEHQA